MTRPWTIRKKIIAYTVIFVANYYYTSCRFIHHRWETLYDELNVPRHGTYDQFVEARDLYIEKLDVEIEQWN
jgi:hypothetical protein